MKQSKGEKQPLCPLAGFAECRGERCMIWDDDWRVCSLNNGSLDSMVRSAVCDAAVEIGKAKGEATSSASANALTPDARKLAKAYGPPEGEGLDAEQIINLFQSFIRATRDEIAAIRKQFGEAGKRD